MEISETLELVFEEIKKILPKDFLKFEKSKYFNSDEYWNLKIGDSEVDLDKDGNVLGSGQCLNSIEEWSIKKNEF